MHILIGIANFITFFTFIWSIPNNIIILVPSDIDNHSLTNVSSNYSNLTVTIVNYTVSLSYADVYKKICETTQLLAVITVGTESNHEKWKGFFQQYGIFYIHIPIDYHFIDNYISVNDSLLTPLNKNYLNILETVIHITNVSQIGIFYNENNKDSPDRLLSVIAQFGSRKNFFTYLLDYSKYNDEELKTLLLAKVYTKIYTVFLIDRNLTSVKRFMSIAKEVGIFKQHYYWAVDTTFMNPVHLLSVFDSSDIPNILSIIPVLKTPVVFNCTTNCSLFGNLFQNLVHVIYTASIQEVTLWPIVSNETCTFNSTIVNTKNLINQAIRSSSNYENLISQFNSYDLYSTKSIDTTFTTPNIFTYATNFQHVFTWNHSSITKNNLKLNYKLKKLYPNTFVGWDNKTIFLCVTVVKPSMDFTANATFRNLNQTEGLVREILNYLSATMDFVAWLYEAPDREFGARIGNSSNFTGCVGEVLKGNAEFAGSVYTFTQQRSEFIEFSHPFMEESNIPVLQKPLPSSKMWHVFRPLSWLVWVLTIASVFILALVSFVCSKWNPLSAWNLELRFAIADEIQLAEHIWNAVGAFLMQGQDFYPYTMSSRSALAVWWLFALIIFSAYTADLTSFLTIQDSNNQMKTLEEVADRTDLSYLIPKGSNLDTLLEISSNPVYKKLNSRKIPTTSMKTCTERLLQPDAKNLVCVTDTSAIVYFVNENCNAVYTVPDTFNTASLGLVLPKNAPFTKIVNAHIQTMIVTGLISRWIDIHWKKSNVQSGGCGSSDDAASNETSTENSADPIDIDGVLGIYLITWGLMLMACVILIAELIVRKFKKKHD